MQIVFWIIYGVTLVAGLFFYGKCELKQDQIKILTQKLKDAKHLKNKAELIMIKDWIDAYKHKEENPYKVLAEISNIINKTALDGDQTD